MDRDLQHPEAKQQDALYDRVIGNFTQLNGNITKVNNLLMETQEINENTVLVSQLWDGYTKNAEFHLSKTNNLKDPLKENQG